MTKEKWRPYWVLTNPATLPVRSAHPGGFSIIDCIIIGVYPVWVSFKTGMSGRKMKKEKITPSVPQFVLSEKEVISQIMMVRGQRVMVDADIARLYGVTTKRLNEQVKRNTDRFPEDFMFQLAQDEKDEVVAKCDHLAKLKFSSTLPYVFTEHGALMVASILNTPQAIEMSVYVVRAFVALRESLSMYKELDQKMKQLERKVGSHDETLRSLVSAIRQLMSPPDDKSKRKIGFK